MSINDYILIGLTLIAVILLGILIKRKISSENS